MKTLLNLCIIPALLTGMTGCSEPLPLKVGICKDNVCANIETVIPARKVRESGKEVVPVEPVQ